MPGDGRVPGSKTTAHKETFSEHGCSSELGLLTCYGLGFTGQRRQRLGNRDSTWPASGAGQVPSSELKKLRSGHGITSAGCWVGPKPAAALAIAAVASAWVMNPAFTSALAAAVNLET